MRQETWRAVAATALLTLLVGAVPVAGAAQWRNRYPRVEGYGHHVYLEGYELPVLTVGPMDPAPGPDGRRLAFSARGWIWVMDLESGIARRLTSGGGMDFRPAWSPDGDRIAFVRDDGADTRIVIADAQSGVELAFIDTPALDLDPAWQPDGDVLFYTSGQAGTLDVWVTDMATGDARPLTSDPGLEMRPQPLADGAGILVLAKRGGDRVELRTAESARPLVSGSIASMARPALHPDGRSFALNWPGPDGWELRLHDLARPGAPVRLFAGDVPPLAPAWSADGRWVYFAQADEQERVGLRRVPSTGGPVENVIVRAWDWGPGAAMSRLRIRTRVAGEEGTVPARLSAVDESGHPALPEIGAPHFDGANGRVFFYSPGLVEVVVPAGRTRVSAVWGLATPESSASVVTTAGEVAEVVLDLDPVWDARATGWVSGDHHFHLNYGGPYDLSPEDMLLKMRGEDLDMATPLLANLHNRYEDQEMWGWETPSGPPLVRFGQEVRSHFLGHVGLLEVPGLHWPWVWGPGYEVFGADDRSNAEVLSFARRNGGMGYYVHPVAVADPFSEEGRGRVPVELVADAVLGHVDALEIMCLWSSFEGTAALWHRLLNLGLEVAPSAGTDVMLNLYRTMALGTTRVYVQTGGATNWPAYLDGLREGRSFVTNGPFLDFRVESGDIVAGPGGVAGPGRVRWSLEMASATPVSQVEVLVNGQVAWSGAGLDAPGSREYEGALELPAGGWIAARAQGGETRWPSMDTSPFAHTAPVWIGERGSTDPVARRSAARELLEVLATSRARLEAGYGDTAIPKLTSVFDEARARLEALAGINN